MKTLEEVKIEYYEWAKNKSTPGYKYGSFASDVFDFLSENGVLQKVCEEACRLQRELCADNAKVARSYIPEGVTHEAKTIVSIDRSSIINSPCPKL